MLVLLLAFMSFTVVCTAFYSYEQYLRILPANTALYEVQLSGMNREEARQAIQPLLQRLTQRNYQINLSESESKVFSADELGIHFDPAQTVRKIFARTSWFATAKSQEEPHQAAVLFDEQKMAEKVREYILSPEKDFQNAEIVWAESAWSIRPETPGLVLKGGEFERVVQSLRTMAASDAATIPIPVEYETVEPLQKTLELEPFLSDIQQKVSKPVTLFFAQEKSQLHFAEKSEWVVFDPIEKTIKINEAFLKEWVETYALERDVAPGEVLITGIEEKISEYDRKSYKRAIYNGDFTHGKIINREKIITSLQDFLNDPSKERTIIVEWQDLLPTIASQVEGYAFPQILSTGISSFRYGNHPNRVKNIKLSLESFQGIVVNPGEELSFNRITGWITPAKGYTKTQVIMEGKVEEGVGGGVCQTSTTFYRSLLNAGVQITERRNHTLDIIYYHDYGYGLDATVYTDSRSDLKFINNFPGPILINTYTDDFKKEAFVEIYGATDHRVVELTEINTGDYLLKKWNWKVLWPDRAEEKIIQSRYQLPKEEEEKPINPLEA